MKVEGEKESFELRGSLREPASMLYRSPDAQLPARLASGSTPASPLHPYWRFLVAGITRHTQTGGVVPSQRFLIRRMIAGVPAGYAGRVVELGPGTGALTMRLAARCEKADILACEINPELAEVVRSRAVSAGLEHRIKVISKPAEEVLQSLARHTGNARPDYIISGIPLGNLSRDSAIALIELIQKALAPGGLYIQFQHSLLDRKKIKARFSRMRTVPVLLNFPPAFVYYAWK